MSSPRPAPLCVADLEQAARLALPPDVWDFIAGGSGEEQTLAANRTALRQRYLTPRVLTGVTRADLRVSWMDDELTMPVGLGPTAYQGLAHPDGEIAAATAAREAGVVYVASILGSRTIEDVGAVGARTWFQLYWLRDRGRTADLLQRAEAAGCRALVVTVDVPALGRRLRDMRNAFVLPETVVAANLTGDRSAAHRRARDASAVMAHTAELIDPALRWDDLHWIRERTTLPIVLKGILAGEDAARAADFGTDAVVVSNHGGRQLDGTVPSLAALPAVVAAVGDRCPVLMDGGIRSGVDVLRALACGASGVLLGRPVLWGLAAGGERGVAELLAVVRAELEQAMVLAGCADVATANGSRR